MVCVRFFVLARRQLDTWDAGEAAQLYADGVLVWSEVPATTATSHCGSTAVDNFVMREIDLGWVSGDSVLLQFTSTVGSAASDESCS